MCSRTVGKLVVVWVQEVLQKPNVGVSTAYLDIMLRNNVRGPTSALTEFLRVSHAEEF